MIIQKKILKKLIFLKNFSAKQAEIDEVAAIKREAEEEERELLEERESREKKKQERFEKEKVRKEREMERKGVELKRIQELHAKQAQEDEAYAQLEAELDGTAHTP